MNAWKKLSVATAGAVCVALGTVGTVKAATLVAPNTRANTEGNSLLNAFSSPVHAQEIFASSQFTPGPQVITQIAFRPDGPNGIPFTLDYSNVQIRLSTTSVTPVTLSSTFSNNVGADVRQVYNGALSLATTNTGPATGPKVFDFVINLQNPFTYNPSTGNLLFDFTSLTGATSNVGPSQQLLDAENGSPFVNAVSTFAAGLPPNASSGTVLGTGLVTQFTTTAVPEPSSTLGILTLAGIAGLKLKHKLKNHKSARSVKQTD